MKKEDPKYVDLLDEDKAIAGQKFACLSFISPEKILKQRELYMFDEYIKQWDMSKSLEKYNHFLNFISYKYSISFEKLTEDLQEFIKSEKDNIFNTNMEDEYKSYLDHNEEKLEQNFNEIYNFQTSTRGIKVRGCFPSQQEAELRCKMLREIDPNHDVYVGPVGMWVPFHPEAYKTGRVEYLEEELNELMNEKNKSEEAAKTEFEKRVLESKQKAIEDNKKKSEESGAKLTQTINDDGELVNIKNMNTTETSLLQDKTLENMAVADLRKELFEGENVVIDYKNSDHGLNSILKNDDTLNMEEVD